MAGWLAIVGKGKREMKWWNDVKERAVSGRMVIGDCGKKREEIRKGIKE